MRVAQLARKCSSFCSASIHPSPSSRKGIVSWLDVLRNQRTWTLMPFQALLSLRTLPPTPRILWPIVQRRRLHTNLRRPPRPTGYEETEAKRRTAITCNENVGAPLQCGEVGSPLMGATAAYFLRADKHRYEKYTSSNLHFSCMSRILLSTTFLPLRNSAPVL